MPSKKYKIAYKKSLDKDLRKLSSVVRLQIVKKIQSLAIDPYQHGSTKLRGANDLYRIRHSDYRIIYQIQDAKLLVLVIKVGHRREVYNN